MGRELLTTTVADLKANPFSGWTWANSGSLASADVNTTTANRIRLNGGTGGAYDWWNGTYSAPWLYKPLYWDQDWEALLRINNIQASDTTTAFAIVMADPADQGVFVRATVGRGSAGVAAGVSYSGGGSITAADDQALWVKAWKKGSAFGLQITTADTRPTLPSSFAYRAQHCGISTQTSRRVDGVLGFGFALLRGAGTGTPTGEISSFEERYF